MDTFIQTKLEEHYTHVKQTLRDYRGAIETMAQELLEKEVIEGERVREIIAAYETEQNMESRLVPIEEH